MTSGKGTLPGLKELIPSDFYYEYRDAVERIKNVEGVVRVVSHYDTDGITAGAIICTALRREGIPYHVSIIKGFGPSYMESLESEDFPLLILSDMGSGLLDRVATLGDRVIIIDHHIPQDPIEEILELNCHRHRIDGTKDACGATLSFLLAISIDAGNWDLLPIAITGAIGDKQNIETGFKGVNKKLVDAGVRAGLLTQRDGIHLPGNTMVEAIRDSISPYFTGLAGNDDATGSWLERFGVDPQENPDKLASQDQHVLPSAIVLKLLEQGTRPEIVEDLFREKYFRPSDCLDLQEFGGEIDACGRRDLAGMGLAHAMGDPSVTQEAKRVRQEYIENVRSQLHDVESNPPEIMKSIQYFELDNDAYAGVVAGIGMHYMFSQDRPTLALNDSDGEIKVSARGTTHLVEHGLDLARAMDKASSEFDGRGGGHPVAAGANLPSANKDAFLERVDSLVSWQMGEEK